MVCGAVVVCVVPSWNVQSNETCAFAGFDTCAERIQVHGSPGVALALSGPMSVGQHGGTVKGCVSVTARQGGVIRFGTTAVTLMLNAPPDANCTIAGDPVAVAVHGVLVLALGAVVLSWYLTFPGPFSVHSYDVTVPVQPGGQVTEAMKLATAVLGAHPLTDGAASVIEGQHGGHAGMTTVAFTGGQPAGSRVVIVTVWVVAAEPAT
jgi:hypothetical protein